MEVKKGYKKTEIGIVPNDWDVVELKTVSKIVRGGSPRPAGDPKYFGGTFMPWLTVAALTNVSESSLYITDSYGYLTQEGVMFSRTLENDTLILSNSGATLGVAKILKIKCCANDGIAAFLTLDKRIDKIYLCYYLNSKTKDLRETVATGNGQPNLNTTLIGNIKIATPQKIVEQKAISNILFDTDNLITALEALLKKKKSVLEGTMQLLLNGDKRLPGFSANWKEIKLDKIVEIHKGNSLSKGKIANAGAYKCILYGELFTVYGRVIRSVVSYTDFEEGKLSVAGDILIPGSTTTSGIDLAIASALEINNVRLGGDINILRKKGNYNSEFLAYYLSHAKKRQIAEKTQGITIIHLYGKDLLDLDIELPSFEEQTSIVRVLNEMTDEIEMITSRILKYKRIKIGMLKELLTGKIRLQ